MRVHELLVTVALFLLVGCTTIEDCQNNPNRSYVIIQFAHNDIVTFDSITYNSLYRLDGDTDTVSLLGFFLDPELSEVNLSFYTDSIDYEIGMSYDAQVQLYEIDCNPSLKISSLDTINHNFDSLVIRQRVLINSNLNGDVTVYF
jgi:hypothetical protein